MPRIAYVAPVLGPNTTRVVRKFAAQPGVQLAIISQQPREALPADLAAKIVGHVRVGNCQSGRQLAEAVRALQPQCGRIDRVVGMLEQIQEALAEAREANNIPGVWMKVARNFRDKDVMKRVLRDAGLPVARSFLATSAADAIRFAELVGFPLIMKPPAGCASIGTVRVRNGDHLWRTLENMAPSKADPVQMEEFITGKEYTCETVSIRGKHVWHSGTRYLNAPLEVLENPWMQYCVLLPRHEQTQPWRNFYPIADAALTALGLTDGISHMEWFLREDGSPVISEVGARPPGAGIMPLMTHANQVDMEVRWARLACFDEWAPLTRKFATGTAFFRGQGNGRVRRVFGLEEAQAKVGSLVVQAKLPVAGQPKGATYEGEGWAVVKHESNEVVIQALRELVSTVQIELG